MSSDVLSSALEQLAKARANILRSKNRQVRSREQRMSLRALAHAWFQSHRNSVSARAAADTLRAADGAYRTILDAAEKNSTKTVYLTAMTGAKAALISLRAESVVDSGILLEAVPDFSPLAGDATMQGILMRRWNECQRCVAANAPLAAIVMMGGLLEALFVAKANRLPDKSVLFKVKSTPLNSQTKKPVDLRDWTLRPYLDVGHELGWISRSTKDVAAVLRDYRNYVHPEKERSHGVILGNGDSDMLWTLTKSLVRQLLEGGTSGA